MVMPIEGVSGVAANKTSTIHTHKTVTPTSVSVTVRMGLSGSFGLVLKGPEAKSSMSPLVSPWARAGVPVTRAICVAEGVGCVLWCLSG